MSLAAAYRSPRRFYGRGIIKKIHSLIWGGGHRGDHNSHLLDERFLIYGCSIVKLDKIGDGVPDRLIGMACGEAREDFFVEYKNLDGKHNKGELRETQKQFFERWRGKPPEIAKTVGDVDEIVRRKRSG